MGRVTCRLQRIPRLFNRLSLVSLIITAAVIVYGWKEIVVKSRPLRVKMMDFPKEQYDALGFQRKHETNPQQSFQQFLLQQQQQQQQHQQLQKKEPQQKPPDQEQGDEHAVISKELQDSQARIASRLLQARNFCQRTNKTATQKRPACHLYSERTHPTKFCPIAKIGSTFWTRFYKILRDATSDELDSPYKVPLGKVDAMRCIRKPNVSAQARKPITAMFVREPFSRVFSAYVDKLLSPNPIYWRHWGQRAMKTDGLAPEHVRCGQGVTFRQFLRLINENLHRDDTHIIPMTMLCDVCEDYDVIGKMETFSGDLKYMMALMDVSFKHDVQISREAKLDAIFDSIQGPFSWLKQIKPCISTPEMGRRIWRKLQIRGLISNHIEYPFGQKDLSNMTREEYYEVAVQAHLKSTDKHKLSQQKQQAFMEAYRTVSFDTIRRYAQIFEDDFEAFGYEKAPTSLFDRDDRFVDTKALDFNRPWVIPVSV